MAKPYISKQKVRDFVSRVSSDKTDAIEEEYEALLAKEIKRSGFGDSVLYSMPASEFLIDRMISRCKSCYHKPPKEWAAICELLKPFVERLAKVRNARQSAYRIIDGAPTGRAAADALREAGLDYYTWENRKPEMVLDLSALKGGD